MSYENEVQQAWRRLGPLGERETCEIARNADTQIAALTERLRAVEAERDEAKRERDASYKALLDLTPGGSEFHNDPMACISFVKGRLSSISMAKIVELKKGLERKDAALKDFAAAWREVAHRSGVKLEAWEDDEYILSAPERGPCGMTIHRRHATVLNAALQPKEPPCQTA